MSTHFNDCKCCNHVLSDEIKAHKWAHWNFDTKSWDIGTAVKQLPYDIVVFETKDGGKFAAPSDSYRLVHAGVVTAIDTKTFVNEQKWREAAVVDQEIDVHVRDEWVKGTIHGLKADIMKYVFRIAKRKSGKLIDYAHMDSLRLAQSSTHTHLYTEAELAAEKEAEQLAEARRVEDLRMRMELVATIPLHDFCHIIEVPQFIHTALVPDRTRKNIRYHDYSKWIRTLRINPDDASKVDFKTRYDAETKDGKPFVNPGLVLLIAEDKKFDCAWETTTTEHKTFTLLNSDANFYTDLRVCGPKEAEYTLECGGIVLGVIHGGETFEFDINNPLVKPVSGAVYSIKSIVPGTLYYKSYYMDTFVSKVLVEKHSPPFIILRVNTLKKYAFLGHLWQPSTEFSFDALTPSLKDSTECT